MCKRPMLSSSNPGGVLFIGPIDFLQQRSQPRRVRRGGGNKETAAGRISQKRRQKPVSDGLIFCQEGRVDKRPYEAAVFSVVRRASVHGGSVDGKEISAGSGEDLFLDMEIHFSVQYVNKFQFIMTVGNHLQMGLGRYGTGDDLDRRQSSLCRRDDCGGAFQYVRTDHKNLRLQFLQSVRTISKGNVRYL